MRRRTPEKRVLDTNIVLPFIRGTENAEESKAILDKFVCILPFCVFSELIYVARGVDPDLTTAEITSKLKAKQVTIALPTEEDTIRAGDIKTFAEEYCKTHPGSLSLADAFVIAIAERLDVGIITGEILWRQLKDAGCHQVPITKLVLL